MAANLKNTSNFDYIYRTKSDLILKIATYYSGNYETGQEIMQDAFLQFYIHHHNLDMGFAEAWLIKTTKNMALNRKKKLSREMIDEQIELTSEYHHKDCSAEETILLKEKHQKTIALKEEIFDALYERNPNWYTIVTLIYCLGKSQTEVANEMHMSIGSLHSMMHRARIWLKKNYGFKYQELRNL